MSRGLRRPSRPEPLPAAVRDAAGLPRGEKVLAAAPTRDGRWLLGTRDRFLTVEPTGERDTLRLAWEEIETAHWDRDAERLQVVEVGEFGRARGVHGYGVDDPGLLLDLVRERVSASVVLQRRVVVEGRRGLFVLARRAPGGSGEIRLACQFDEGLDPQDPVVGLAAEEGLRAAAEELGL